MSVAKLSRKYWFGYFLPGLVLIGLAFFVGSQPSMIFGFLSFLCLFVMGVVLIVEGKKKSLESDDSKR